jgi:hypothetical protein
MASGYRWILGRTRPRSFISGRSSRKSAEAITQFMMFSYAQRLTISSPYRTTEDCCGGGPFFPSGDPMENSAAVAFSIFRSGIRPLVSSEWPAQKPLGRSGCNSLILRDRNSRISTAQNHMIVGTANVFNQ